jgi:hypothetical protein
LRKTLAFSIIIVNLLIFSFAISFYLDSSITENRPKFSFTSEKSNNAFEIENSVTIPSLAKNEQIFTGDSPSKKISETTISNNESEQGSWTYMFYLAADNDIEGDAVLDVEELERGAGVNEDVNFIVLFDRTPGLHPIPGYDSSHGNWTGSRYYKIAEDQSPDSFESILLEDLGEIDMSDPETLRNFLGYCFQNYPAEHYCLDIWNHGWGVNGMCLDETDGTEEGGWGLTLDEIQQAITNATTTFSTRIDVISMDACNMQTVEVAWELRNLCDYLLASEAGTPGWEYEPISQGLYDNSSLTPLALCKLMVDAYQLYFGSFPNLCLSVIDMAMISDILPFFNDFAEQLTYTISELNYGSFRSLVRENSFEFFYGDYVDIEAFAINVKSIIPYEPLQLAVDELVDFLNDLVVYNWQHQQYQGSANGLMVYLPFGENIAEPPSIRIRNYVERLDALAGMDWQDDSYWDEFLAIYRQKGLYYFLEDSPWLNLGEPTTSYTLAENSFQFFTVFLLKKDIYESYCPITSGDVDIHIIYVGISDIRFIGRSSLINPDDSSAECCRFYRQPGLFNHYIIVEGKASTSTFTIEIDVYNPQNLACNIPQTASGGTSGGDGTGHFIQDLPHYFRTELSKGNYSIILTNSENTDYQLTIYDDSGSELYYLPTAGLGQTITLNYNHTEEELVVFILEVLGFEGAGAFTIEVRDNIHTSKTGLSFLSSVLLSVLLLFSISLRRHKR